MATQATPTVTPTVTSDPTTTPPDGWLVILVDDPVNLVPYVAAVLRKIFGFSAEEAMQLTMKVDKEGKAVVWKGPREAAEAYCVQLGAAKLWTRLAED